MKIEPLPKQGKAPGGRSAEWVNQRRLLYSVGRPRVSPPQTAVRPRASSPLAAASGPPREASCRSVRQVFGSVFLRCGNSSFPLVCRRCPRRRARRDPLRDGGGPPDSALAHLAPAAAPRQLLDHGGPRRRRRIRQHRGAREGLRNRAWATATAAYLAWAIDTRPSRPAAAAPARTAPSRRLCRSHR